MDDDESVVSRITLSGSENSNHLIYSFPYIIEDNNVYIISLIGANDSVEVNYLHTRNYGNFVEKISFLHVAALALKFIDFNYLLREIALSVNKTKLLNNEQVPGALNTDHIVTYKQAPNSLGILSYLLYSTEKVDNRDIWLISFLAAVEFPFLIEVVIVHASDKSKSYVVPIEQLYLRDIFRNTCCKGRNNKPRNMFDRIVSQLFFMEDQNIFVIKEIEKIKLKQEVSMYVGSKMKEDTIANKNATVSTPKEELLNISVIENDNVAASPIHLLVSDSLKTTPSQRSKTQQRIITDYLKSIPLFHTNGFHKCSKQDTLLFTNDCAYKVISCPNNTYLCIKNELQDSLYIVLQGSVDIIYENGYREAGGPGSVVGASVFHGETKWDHDVIIKSTTNSNVKTDSACLLSLCSIPIASISQYLGFTGNNTEEFLLMFWKFYSLYEFVIEPKIMPLFYISQDTSLITTKNDDDQSVISTSIIIKDNKIESMDSILSYDIIQENNINVTKNMRIKSFRANSEIFSEGNTRNNMYIVLSGECIYLRKTANPLLPELNTGIILLSGDFSFLDGENNNFAISQKEHIKKMSRITRLNRLEYYGRHRYTLYATTKVEVITIPLHEINKSLSLFTNLLSAANRKYKLLLRDEHEYIQEYLSSTNWNIDKKMVVKDIYIDKQSIHDESKMKKVNRKISQYNDDIHNSQVQVNVFQSGPLRPKSGNKSMKSPRKNKNFVTEM